MSVPKQQSIDASSSIQFENLRSSKRSIPATKRWNPLLKVSITKRLILGFIFPALIAALSAGVIGVQSMQLLSKEADFYQNFFHTYANLTTGGNYLQLMDSKVHSTLNDATQPTTDHDTLVSDQQALQNLSTRYDSLLSNYIHNDLLDQHPEQVTLFTDAGHVVQTQQQRSLAYSAMRTWQTYRTTQDQVIQDTLNGNLAEAQTLEHVQGEATQADALSALHTLVQFDSDLVNSVRDATDGEQQQILLLTLAAALGVFLAIGVIGWLISSTLIPRLQALRKVVQFVEEGQVQARVPVDGRDEITDVASSVNTMLDTIVGLLEETRRQRDALVQASERLFADLRMTNGGEIQISAAANNDPVGMLANAFNFTIGRFRRFMLRTQSTADQLDLLARLSNEHKDAFVQATQQLLHASVSIAVTAQKEDAPTENSPLLPHLQRASTLLDQIANRIDEQALQTMVQNAERYYYLCQQLTSAMRANGVTGTPMQAQQLRAMEMALTQLKSTEQLLAGHMTRERVELDNIVKQLAVSMQHGGVTRPSGTGITVLQVQELSRLIDSFSDSTTTLIQQLRGITKDMRNNLKPFQIGTIIQPE